MEGVEGFFEDDLGVLGVGVGGGVFESGELFEEGVEFVAGTGGEAVEGVVAEEEFLVGFVEGRFGKAGGEVAAHCEGGFCGDLGEGLFADRTEEEFEVFAGFLVDAGDATGRGWFCAGQEVDEESDGGEDDEGDDDPTIPRHVHPGEEGCGVDDVVEFVVHAM